MSASTNDKISDTRNAARPNSARASGTRAAGGTSLACDSLTGWPTVSKVHFVTYKIDANSNPVAGTQLDCTGIVSGNSLTSIVVVDGTDAGNAVNDVVEMLPTANYGHELFTALTKEHNQLDGSHKAITTDTITVTSGSTLPAGDIGTADLAASAVTTAKINNAAVTAAKMFYGMVRGRQGGTTGDATWVTGGTGNTDTSAKDVMIQAGSTGTINSSVTVTFPSAFTQVPLVFVTTSTAASLNNVCNYVTSISTTQCTINQVNANSGASSTTEKAFWVAIGQ